jgi:hypothetical protein
MKSIRPFIAALAALSLTALAAFAGDPSGTWKFQAEGPGGRSAESTLTLKLQDNQLTGTIENRAGKAEITAATFKDDQIAFTVVREIGRRLRKQTFTIHYAGKLAGDTITGTIETTGREQKPISIAWEARRVQ